MMESDLNIIYEYFPQNIDPSDLEYTNTKEIKCQINFIEFERNKKTQFEEMNNFIEKQLNCQYKTDLSFKGIFDLSRKTLFKLPNNFHHKEYPFFLISLSALVPYFDIYFTKFQGIPTNTVTSDKKVDGHDFLKKHIGHLVSSYFIGYDLIPYEYFNKSVPKIFSAKNYGANASFYECLMTDTLW